MVTAERPKVLIVDDQPRNLDALEAMLAPADCVLVRAQSADEALLSLLRHEFAAIVLDIRMPGITGIELAQLIKQRKRSEHIPILFLTAHTADESDILQGSGAGAVDYLSKPVNPDILRSKIGVFIELFRKTRALADLNDALQREVVERQTVQAALERVNQELESRVQERTLALSRAHQGVQENEARLRMALDVAQMTAWEWHLASGQMTWASDPEELFGFPAGGFGPERRTTGVIHVDDRERVSACLHDALPTGLYDCDYRVVRPDGSVVWLTERGRIVPEWSGQGDRMIGLTRNVTRERESEREREELLRQARDARDEAERQVRLKDEFLATLSHELRTPMNAMLGWLAIVQEDAALPADVRTRIEVIDRNARAQAKLIEDLLDMNRLMTGNVQLELESVDLAVLAESTVQTLRPTADAKTVRLSLESPQAGSVVNGDVRRLQQVLFNLVHNAVKFTPGGGHVVVRVQAADALVRLVVSDSGCGITSTFLPYVFERFRQEDSSSTRQSHGLGLGLSISRHLAELHGGTIRAASDGAGRGSTFVFELPRASSAASDTLPLLAANGAAD
jgi:PAS domain S-box-containing protein